VDMERRQSWWWFLFVIGAALLLGEAVLSNRQSKGFSGARASPV